MLEFSVLSSGSKANALYVTDGSTRILVDCGLSAREISLRLAKIGVEPASIDALLISHEHSDHIRGVPIFAAKHCLDVWATAGTFSVWNGRADVPCFNRREFRAGDSFELGGLSVQTFSILHDAKDPVAFRVAAGNCALGVITDLGAVTDVVAHHTANVDALVLESNHDLLLLKENHYPEHLKARIRSNTGHLSNEQAADIVRRLSAKRDGRLQVLIGGHISENSNHPALVRDSFVNAWGEGEADHMPEILVADVYAPTRMFALAD